MTRKNIRFLLTDLYSLHDLERLLPKALSNPVKSHTTYLTIIAVITFDVALAPASQSHRFRNRPFPSLTLTSWGKEVCDRNPVTRRPEERLSTLNTHHHGGTRIIRRRKAALVLCVTCM